MTVPLEYSTPKAEDGSSRAALVVLAVGASINLIAITWLVYLNFSSLWSVPPGTPIRPMALATWDLMGSAASWLLSTVLSILALIHGWRWKRIWYLAILLFCLGFAPAVAALGTAGWIIDVHHLVLEP